MSLVRAVILLCSILLLTQSIFGSPFKQEHHVKRRPGSSTNDTEIQGRQGSSSISTFKEGEKKNKPRDLISGGTLGVHALRLVLDLLGNINRKVAIGVDNESKYQWQAIKYYLAHGTSDLVLPFRVPSGKALTWGARRTAGPFVPFGAEGVFTYYIPDIKKTLAVMFSVPFNYAFNDNQVDVQLKEGRIKANKALWTSMYRFNPSKFKGDGSWQEKNLEPDKGEKGIRAQFSMSTSGQATMEIKILPRKSRWSLG